jgi:hypothetical protein
MGVFRISTTIGISYVSGNREKQMVWQQTMKLAIK